MNRIEFFTWLDNTPFEWEQVYDDYGNTTVRFIYEETDREPKDLDESEQYRANKLNRGNKNG